MKKNIIQNALNKIKNDEKCKPKYNVINIKGKTGPTGPAGPTGKTETIRIGQTTTVEPNEKAEVIDTNIDGHHTLDFKIPKGTKGDSFNVLGSYDTIDELKKNHPTGNIGDAYIIDGDIYVWSDNTKDWKNIGKIKGPKGDIGPTGPIGPTGAIGPTGPTLIKSAYIVTYNDLTNEDGLPIISGAKIPLKRKELDVGNIITLNSNYTIRFNSIGYYKISFTVFAYPKVDSIDFDPTKDIVSIGFKESNTNNVYVGASSWVWNGEAIEIYTSGIISVPNTNSLYELTNLSKETIYLNTPNIENISSTSYFSNSLVTLLIDYLGRD